METGYLLFEIVEEREKLLQNNINAIGIGISTTDEGVTLVVVFS